MVGINTDGGIIRAEVDAGGVCCTVRCSFFPTLDAMWYLVDLSSVTVQYQSVQEEIEFCLKSVSLFGVALLGARCRCQRRWHNLRFLRTALVPVMSILELILGNSAIFSALVFAVAFLLDGVLNEAGLSDSSTRELISGSADTFVGFSR